MIFIKTNLLLEMKWHLDLSVVTLKCFHLQLIIEGGKKENQAVYSQFDIFTVTVNKVLKTIRQESQV